VAKKSNIVIWSIAIVIALAIGGEIVSTYRSRRPEERKIVLDTPHAVMGRFQSLMAESKLSDAAAMVALPATFAEEDGNRWVLSAPGTDYPHISTVRGTVAQWSHRFARGKIVAYEPVEPEALQTDLSFGLHTPIMCDPTAVVTFSVKQEKIHVRIDPFRNSPQDFVFD
jgi:hypothetical protein